MLFDAFSRTSYVNGVIMNLESNLSDLNMVIRILTTSILSLFLMICWPSYRIGKDLYMGVLQRILFMAKFDEKFFDDFAIVIWVSGLRVSLSLLSVLEA